ncbi:MAG: endonuclease MutS2 [Proteocatella sp.]
MEKKTLNVLEYETIINLLEDCASTELGKNRVHQISVSRDPQEIKMSLQETSEAQSIILKKGSLPIYSLSDVGRSLKLAEIGSSIDIGNILKIGGILKTARFVSSKISGIGELEIIKELADGLYSDQLLEERIYDSIISEEEISDNASPELKKIRRTIRSSKEQIRTKINAMVSSESSSKYLQDAIVTMRQDRFVVPVKTENRSNVPGIVHDTSSSGATLFIEPMAIVEMNNNIRILMNKEHEEIEKIIMELSNQIGLVASEIAENTKRLTRLDFIMAKGKLSVKMKATEPAINDLLAIKLRNARHPLIDPKAVVPLNIEIGHEYKTLIITGPNTGGKTVALKTVGLMSLMFQSGLHIPCDYGSSMCIFKNIFADIGDEQSIEQSLSTFSSHMTHIVKILAEMDDRDLILLDELGSGTDPIEGSALAISILEDIRQKNIITMATTHYSELKNYALERDGVENASVEFNIETLSPTYRLIIGIPGKSNAFDISKKLGLSQEIIDAARSRLSEDEIKMEDLLNKIEKDRKAIEKEKEYAISASMEIRKKEDEIKQKEMKTKSDREKILLESKKKASQLLKEAKEESDSIIKELNTIGAEVEKYNVNKEIEKVRSKIKTGLEKFGYTEDLLGLDDFEGKALSNVTLGQKVFVQSFGQEGNIVSIDESKREAVVQVGIMKINMPFEALQKPKKVKTKEIRKTGAGKILRDKATTIKSEVDVRGMDLESARIEVEKYLDNAYLSGIPRATIIHGVGTMVLKKGINEMLKSLKYLKDYRQGVYGEGGIGVTIVEFK